MFCRSSCGMGGTCSGCGASGTSSGKTAGSSGFPSAGAGSSATAKSICLLTSSSASAGFSASGARRGGVLFVSSTGFSSTGGGGASSSAAVSGRVTGFSRGGKTAGGFIFNFSLWFLLIGLPAWTIGISRSEVFSGVFVCACSGGKASSSMALPGDLITTPWLRLRASPMKVAGSSGSARINSCTACAKRNSKLCFSRYLAPAALAFERDFC
mmetsp:Transcript_125640/g.217550  ORF Transcript_125640/g.217550 Transcript_125640/m.217550 type:complete len:212 (+) Transcript_125640:397-1032(+)